MRSILLAGVLALAGCAPAGPPAMAAEAIDSSRNVAIGGTARVGGVAVTPLAVLEDSRCPKDVTCIWAGRVLIRARIAAAGRTSEAEMELGKPLTTSGNAAIVLAQVWPERTSGVAIGSDDYRFVFAPAE
jgi:hypothetical protein